MHGAEWAEEDCELPIVLSLLLGADEVDAHTLWVPAARVHDAAAAAARTYERYRAACRHLPERARGDSDTAQ